MARVIESVTVGDATVDMEFDQAAQRAFGRGWVVRSWRWREGVAGGPPAGVRLGGIVYGPYETREQANRVLSAMVERGTDGLADDVAATAIEEAARG